jgi:N-acylglucosamine-6-phosphate 2-epimerase
MYEQYYPRAGVQVVPAPTLAHAIAVAEAGAEIVAIDGTRRDCPDGLTLAETIRAIHETTGALVMADAGSLEDGQSAQDAGADIVGTTLSGYTGARPRTIGPDLELISEMATALSVPVFAEGRIERPPKRARRSTEAPTRSLSVRQSPIPPQ